MVLRRPTEAPTHHRVPIKKEFRSGSCPRTLGDKRRKRCVMLQLMQFGKRRGGATQSTSKSNPYLRGTGQEWSLHRDCRRADTDRSQLGSHCRDDTKLSFFQPIDSECFHFVNLSRGGNSIAMCAFRLLADERSVAPGDTPFTELIR